MTGISHGTTALSVDSSGVTVISGDYGTLTIHPNGDYDYTLTTNDPHHTSQGTGVDGQTDAFTYTVTDAFGNTNTSTITIAIKDDVPTAVNDTATVTEGQSVSGNVALLGDSSTHVGARHARRRWRGRDRSHQQQCVG